MNQARPAAQTRGLASPSRRQSPTRVIGVGSHVPVEATGAVAKPTSVFGVKLSSAIAAGTGHQRGDCAQDRPEDPRPAGRGPSAPPAVVGAAKAAPLP